MSGRVPRLPTSRNHSLALLKVEVAQRQTARARSRLQAILAARADHPFAHGLLGEVLALLGEHEAATREYREAVRLNPKWLIPWVELGRVVTLREPTCRSSPNRRGRAEVQSGKRRIIHVAGVCAFCARTR